MEKDKFVKYDHIENSYNNQFIDYFKETLKFNKFVIMEKLDGANFQIKIFPDFTIKYGSRNIYLTEDFYNYKEVVDKIDLSLLKKEANYNDNVIILYGELYGKGIQNRIDYGKDKHIKFFDVKINNKFLAYDEFKMFCENFNLSIVPVIKENIFFDEAINFEVDNMITLINPFKNNYAEGVVIRIYDNEIFKGHSRFILKKKAKNFIEKSIKKKIIRQKKEINLNLLKYKEEVSRYINKNRILSLFSKIGKIESNNDLGIYIKEINKDVKIDFMKDNPDFDENDFSKMELRYIFNYSKKIVGYLKEFM